MPSALNKLASLISTAFLAALSACATTNPSTQPKANQVADALFDTISALDTAVFDSFNDCSSPGQLEKHASYFAIFPLKDFGAIEQGVHRFCQFKTGDCEGMADFLIVWRNQGDTWQITGVLSYGHRPNK